MKKFKKDFSVFQKGIERMETAMCGIPDRVPVFAQMHEFAMKEHRANAKEFLPRQSIYRLRIWLF